jgi:DNA-binding transcriptional MerR regulator
MTMGAHDSYTIDELALAAGMTPRNVRAYRTKGLLSPPVRVGRSSRYRIAHLHRLRDIRQLREAGLPLKLIIEAAQRGEDLGPTGVLWRAAGQIPAQARDAPDNAPSPGSGPGSSSRFGAGSGPADGSVPSIAVHPEAYALMWTLTRGGLNQSTVLLLALRAARAGNALAADLSLLLAGHAESLQPGDASLSARAAVIDLATLITRDMLGQNL